MRQRSRCGQVRCLSQGCEMFPIRARHEISVRGDEEGKISAFRDRNNVRLTLPFGLKVGAQSFSQLAGLDADNAVLAHVVVRRAMKNVDRDLLFLDLIQGFTAESTVAYISEKLLELRRFLKTVTRENR